MMAVIVAQMTMSWHHWSSLPLFAYAMTAAVAVPMTVTWHCQLSLASC
jgi:hypothetical protein